MSKHRRFSWESSMTRNGSLFADFGQGRVSPVDREQPDLPTSKDKGPEQSAERNVEQRPEQSVTPNANEHLADITCNASFQSRSQVRAAINLSPEPAMFVRPHTPIDPVQRINRQPSPLTYESYKRDGWVISDDPLYKSDTNDTSIKYNKSPEGASVTYGRQSRFDSAVEKNNGDLTRSAGTLENHPDVSTHTWPRARLRRSNRTLSPVQNESTPAPSIFPANSIGSCDDRPPVPAKDSNSSHKFGSWYCCMCDDTHAVIPHTEGPHLIDRLRCECSHKPCQDCEFSGYIKMYCPVDEQPAVVLMSGDRDEQIKFGVICLECGLSWRAQHVKKDNSKMRTVLHKISALPKRLNRTQSLQKLRQASVSMMNLSRPESSLSKTRSVANLRSVSETKKNAETSTKEVGEQAESAKVRFFGIVCACGRVTEPESVCFHITDVPWGTPEADLERTKVEIRQRVGLTSPPELQAKGHRDPVIHLKGGRHPNPLLSSPVDEFRRRTLYVGGQQLPGEDTLEACD